MIFPKKVSPERDLSPNKKGRIEVLDAADGLAILRVVFFHALVNYQIIGCERPFVFTEIPFRARVLTLLLQFSVPIFLCVSGFKWALSRERHPERRYRAYILHRFHRLGVPFLLWTLIYYLVIPVTNPMLRSLEVFTSWPVPPPKLFLKIITGAVPAAYQLWFIPMLLCVNLIYPIFKRIFPRAWVSLPVSLLIYALCVRASLAHPMDYVKYLVFQDIGVFAYGVYNRRHGARRFFLYGGISAGVPAVGWSVARLFSHDTSYVSRLEGRLEFFVPVSIFLILLGCRPGRCGRVLSFWGRRAWRIFILHAPLVLFNTGWLVYRVFHITHPAAFFVVGIVATTASLAISRAMDRLKLGGLLFRDRPRTASSRTP